MRGFVLSGALLAPAASNAAQSHAPDNTAVNKQYRDSQRPMADQAKDNRSDRNLAEQIRRDVVHDKSLSIYGHYAKIIADNGLVRCADQFVRKIKNELSKDTPANTRALAM